MNSKTFASLSTVWPQVEPSQLLLDFVPPREFANARFDSYKPSPDFESQSVALAHSREFISGKRKGLFSKPVFEAGIYLDGGFGVGKTHLLASIWHEFSGKKAFGAFISFTGLIGALGFAETVQVLKKYELLCIDEFELDDPGDTMMMSRLLNELAPLGVRFAATSNTPPNALGEGRFAAADFAREIHGIADRFQMVRIDGEDYRHRPTSFDFVSYEESAAFEKVATYSPNAVAVDDFEELLAHLSKVHPSRYGRLLSGVEALVLKDIHVLHDQVNALRFVSFVDRAYEAQLRIFGTGIDLVNVFSDEYISGAYRKKYLRAISRLGAMTR